MLACTHTHACLHMRTHTGFTGTWLRRFQRAAALKLLTNQRSCAQTWDLISSKKHWSKYFWADHLHFHSQRKQKNCDSAKPVESLAWSGRRYFNAHFAVIINHNIYAYDYNKVHFYKQHLCQLSILLPPMFHENIFVKNLLFWTFPQQYTVHENKNKPSLDTQPGVYMYTKTKYTSYTKISQCLEHTRLKIFTQWILCNDNTSVGGSLGDNGMGKRVKETVAMEISLSQKFGLIIRLKPFVMYVALWITKD